MPIREENLKRMGSLEKNLKDQLMWLNRNQIELNLRTIESMRSLKQFIVGLSTAIIGVIFPIISLTHNSSSATLTVSLGMFSLIVIYGVCNLSATLSKELLDLPKVTKHHSNQLLVLIREVQDIQTIEDNDTAGRRYMDLENKYKKLNLSEPNLMIRLWYKFEDSVFLSFFIVAYFYLLVYLFGLFI